MQTPIGEPCTRCNEPIDTLDCGVRMPHIPHGWSTLHRECYLRGVFGSVAHQRGECSCFGGTHEDSPELTVRQAAAAAVRYFQTHNRDGDT